MYKRKEGTYEKQIRFHHQLLEFFFFFFHTHTHIEFLYYMQIYTYQLVLVYYHTKALHLWSDPPTQTHTHTRTPTNIYRNWKQKSSNQLLLQLKTKGHTPWERGKRMNMENIQMIRYIPPPLISKSQIYKTFSSINIILKNKREEKHRSLVCIIHRTFIHYYLA